MEYGHNESQIFFKISEEEEKFHQLLIDKDIIPKNIDDIERIERLFNSSLETISNIVKKSTFSESEKEFILCKLIIDFHGRTAEKYGFDFFTFPELLGKSNAEKFLKAIEKFNKKYM